MSDPRDENRVAVDPLVSTRDIGDLAFEHGDDDPDYQAFVIQVAGHCRCVRGPCDGVLDGGLCDGFDEAWEERHRPDGYEGNEDGRWDDYPYV